MRYFGASGRSVKSLSRAIPKRFLKRRSLIRDVRQWTNRQSKQNHNELPPKLIVLTFIKYRKNRGSAVTRLLPGKADWCRIPLSHNMNIWRRLQKRHQAASGSETATASKKSHFEVMWKTGQSFAIPVALPNTYTNLHYGLHNFIILSWHFALHYIVIWHFYSYCKAVAYVMQKNIDWVSWLTENLADMGVVYVRIGFEYLASLLLGPHHERVHWPLDVSRAANCCCCCCCWWW